MYKALVAAVSLTAALVACATTRRDREACAVSSIDELFANPMAYAGRLFCGRASVVRLANELFVVRTFQDARSRDMVFIVTTRTGHHLRQVGSSPVTYWLEARVDPHAPCFQPPEPSNGETCVPWIRPVSMHVRRARRISQRP